MDIWNIKDLEPPPVTMCRVTSKQIDIRLLDAILTEGVNFFKNQQHLFTEAALLSRAVYRFKMKFRSSKDFKSIEKLNHILHIQQKMEVSNMLKMLSNTIPQHYTVNKTYMLTKNMMDYVLVRLQGLGKLLCRTLELCKEVSKLMQLRLRLGHFWKVAIVVFATAARVFVTTKIVLKYTCELYGNLLPYSSSLGNPGVQWLPEGYTFPSHLDEWLNIDWLDLDNAVIEIPDDEPILSYLKLTDSDDEVEFCDEYILVKDDNTMISEETEPCETIDICEDSVIVCDEFKTVESVEIDDEDEDIGEVISISDSEAQKTPKRRSKKRASKKLETSDADVGVVVNIEDQEGRKLKKSRKKQRPKSLVKKRKRQSKFKVHENKKVKRGSVSSLRNAHTVVPTGSKKKKKVKRRAQFF